eukprot:scaffold28217_cov112-Isochrysis_galbana.AAC.3
MQQYDKYEHAITNRHSGAAAAAALFLQLRRRRRAQACTPSRFHWAPAPLCATSDVPSFVDDEHEAGEVPGLHHGRVQRVVARGAGGGE